MLQIAAHTYAFPFRFFAPAFDLFDQLHSYFPQWLRLRRKANPTDGNGAPAVTDSRENMETSIPCSCCSVDSRKMLEPLGNSQEVLNKVEETGNEV